MLQKILVILVGLVMSLIGALTPSATFAAKDGHTDLAAATSTIDQTLATVKGADGSAFAKIPVLWIEIDGRRVTDDAWGTGEIKELKARVGVKDVEGASLAVGDKLVPIHPTDVLTIRMFHGDFAYRDVGEATETLQLQGTVKTTTVHEGDSTGKLTTATSGSGDALSQKFLASQDPTRVAFVVLGTGESVDTVKLQPGGERLYTEAAVATDAASGSGAAQHASELGNLLVKWVKIDAKPVREYTWGNGVLSSIEFEPTNESGAALLKFRDGEADTAPAGGHVLVKDFVGEYMVYQVTGGLLRLRLDGYASDVATGAGALAGVASGAPGAPGVPHAAFEFGPSAATTAQSISFQDRSTDDGIVVFWRWTFGDGTTSVLQSPTHRYAKPGVYNVTLDITDEELNAAEVVQQVVITDAPPMVAFEALPNLVTTDTLVAFTDRTTDSDGLPVNWTWDFGDGTLSYARHPNHRFTSSGVKNVTLAVRDDLGTVASLTKTVIVRNEPPTAMFQVTPAPTTANVPYTFTSQSTDKDGTIVDLAWNFGDDPKNLRGAQAHGDTVVHQFAGPGVYKVTLTAKDNVGDVDTHIVSLPILDQPPVANFTFETDYSLSGSDITFLSTAYDPDPNGFILTEEWDFGDGHDFIIDDAANTTDPTHADFGKAVDDAQKGVRGYNGTLETVPGLERHVVTNNYSRPGTYNVRLTVRDNFLQPTTTNQTVHIKNRPPVARIVGIADGNWTRNTTIPFSGSLSSDDVGITSAHWEFGDGTTRDGFLDALHPYAALGVYQVNLTVGDGEYFNTARVNVTIFDAPPVPEIQGDPFYGFFPSASQPFELKGTFRDPDNSPGVPQWHWNWTLGEFPDETTQVINHTFAGAGVHEVRLTVTDGEGATSTTQAVALITVGPARPRPSFTFTDPAIEGQPETFTDTSVPGNATSGYIKAREWTWGDNTQTGGPSDPNSNLSVANHTFQCPNTGGPAPWVRAVKLRVTDNENPTFGPSLPTATNLVTVDCLPTVRFALNPPASANVGQPVALVDTSTDPDPFPSTALLNMTIDWGDGSPMTVMPNGTNTSHAYGAPGTRTITVTGRDDGGATRVLTRNITITDRAPNARFSWDRPAIAGSGTQFHDASVDPDGGPVAGWAWDFGDGETSTEQNPNHTFARSGLYRVQLITSDGNLQSNPYDTQSIQWVRVGGASAIDLPIIGKTPYGGNASLGSPSIDITLSLSSSDSPNLQLHKSDFHIDAVGGHFTLQANAWMGGSRWRIADRVTIHVTDSSIPGWSGTSIYYNMSDDMISGVTPTEFLLPLPYVPTVTASPSPNAPNTADGDAVYSDTTSHFRGVGHVAYKDGHYASNVDYTLWIRVLPIYLGQHGGHAGSGEALRNYTPEPTGILGWCQVGSGQTDASGNLVWDIPRDRTGCGSTELPLGHYEVQLRVSSLTNMPAVSAPAEIYVDPTPGQILANLYLP